MLQQSQALLDVIKKCSDSPNEAHSTVKITGKEFLQCTNRDVSGYYALYMILTCAVVGVYNFGDDFFEPIDVNQFFNFFKGFY